MPEMQGIPSQQPPVGAEGQQGQPSSQIGSSPATQAVRNQGYEAAGMARVRMILNLMSETLPMVGATSELGKGLLDAITKLSKGVPAGATSPASEKNQLQQLMLRQQQASPQMAMMRSQPQQQPQGM